MKFLISLVEQGDNLHKISLNESIRTSTKAQISPAFFNLLSNIDVVTSVIYFDNFNPINSAAIDSKCSAVIFFSLLINAVFFFKEESSWARSSSPTNKWMYL